MVTVYVVLPIRTWMVLFVLEMVGMVWGILRSSIRAWCVPSRTSVDGSWIVMSDDVPEILSRLSTKICLIYRCEGFMRMCTQSSTRRSKAIVFIYKDEAKLRPNAYVI